MAQFYNNIKYTAIFFITLLVFASSGMALFPGSVLCISGNDRVFLEFGYCSHIHCYKSQDFNGANSRSINLPDQQNTADQCQDIPGTLSSLKVNSASTRPFFHTSGAATYGSSIVPSIFVHNSLNVAGNRLLRTYEPPFSLSLCTTVLLI